MCGEFPYTGKLLVNFTAIYRAAIGACVAGQGDIMVGAAINMARANGLSMRASRTSSTRWPSTTRSPTAWAWAP